MFGERVEFDFKLEIRGLHVGTIFLVQFLLSGFISIYNGLKKIPQAQNAPSAVWLSVMTFSLIHRSQNQECPNIGFKFKCLIYKKNTCACINDSSKRLKTWVRVVVQQVKENIHDRGEIWNITYLIKNLMFGPWEKGFYYPVNCFRFVSCSFCILWRWD